MSDLLLGAAGLLLVGSNLFWIYRTRTVERSIERAQMLEAGDGSDSATLRGPSGDTGGRGPVYEAAAAADVQPNALPDEIDRLQDRTDHLSERVEEVRESMAGVCWEAFFEGTDADSSPYVVHVELDGNSEMARDAARAALEHDDLIGIVTAREDGSFAVGVGASLAEAHSAREVAADLVSVAGSGGSSGSDRLASGGGAEARSLADAAEEVASRLREEG